MTGSVVHEAAAEIDARLSGRDLGSSSRIRQYPCTERRRALHSRSRSRLRPCRESRRHRHPGLLIAVILGVRIFRSGVLVDDAEVVVRNWLSTTRVRIVPGLAVREGTVSRTRLRRAEFWVGDRRVAKANAVGSDDLFRR